MKIDTTYYVAIFVLVYFIRFAHLFSTLTYFDQESN